MKNRAFIMAILLIGVQSTILTGISQGAYDSGGSCSPAFINVATCRNAFAPTVDTVVPLPPSGILDYTTFTVPTGVTVTFGKNAANTPVIIRVSGDVTIAGTIALNGSTAPDTGAAGNGVLADDGQPGVGGPGGYDGGWGGLAAGFGGVAYSFGGAGKGPGGGLPPDSSNQNTYSASGVAIGGGGGSFGTVGLQIFGPVARTYGGNLLPLIGGSGGGGGTSSSVFNGAGGGGGGGAILIAASGTITVSGAITADGGSGGASSGGGTTGVGSGGAGGGGSGGAIRLIADTITGAGALYARGGTSGYSYNFYPGYFAGGKGIIRSEANTYQWSGTVDPAVVITSAPGPIFAPNNPTLTFTTVAGLPTPAVLTGVNDVTLPTGTTSATLGLAATNIPRGTVLTVRVVPSTGVGSTEISSTPLAGSTDAASTATATIPLVAGNNVVMATATYTVTQVVALSLPRYGGEYVAKVRVESVMGGGSKIIHVTTSGKEYVANSGKPA